MPVYRYKGVTAGNNSVSSTIDAENIRTARARLRSDGIFPTEISEGKTRSLSSDFLTRFELPQLRRVPDLDLSMFTSQLATLLSAGVPLVQSLGALTEQVENEQLKPIVGLLRDSVNQGSTLADAMN
jgi:type II secretory pathway component PulF